jgi:hypothetical protein
MTSSENKHTRQVRAQLQTTPLVASNGTAYLIVLPQTKLHLTFMTYFKLLTFAFGYLIKQIGVST